MDNNLSFIHVFKPAQNITNPRTLLLLHGTGGDENDLLSIGSQIDPTANILSPRGKVLENGMLRFFVRFPDGTFDLDDLRTRTNELSDFVAKASIHYGFDAQQVVSVGYSNGANISASILLTNPSVLQAAVLLRPTVPFVPDNLPNLSGKKILICGGEQDTMILPASTKKLIDVLKSAGANVQEFWQQTGHRLTPQDIERAGEFVRQL
ncbi:MAG: alpha/beta hydrolase [Candidatus Peribacteraceae bacterium]|nr:alpha/beta hydrolase [Candidatus Peribacteraceae bacterium]